MVLSGRIEVDVLLGVYCRVGAVLRLRMFNVYSDGCILTGVVWPDEPGKQMLGVDVVLSAGEEDGDSLTDEKLCIGVRKGRLSNCAMGG